MKRHGSIMVVDPPLSPRKKSVMGIQTPSSTRKSFQKNYRKSLAEVLDEYTGKLVYNFKQLAEDSTNQTILLLDQLFSEKMNVTLNYDDQIKELQLMSEDDPGNQNY